jgi:hypothetical protein
MLKITSMYERDTCGKNSRTFLAKFLLLCYQVTLLVTVRALAGVSGMIRTQTGKYSKSNGRSGWDA